MENPLLVSNVIFALAGIYLISVENTLASKTPLVYLGIAFVLPLIFQIILKFKN